MNLLVSDIHSNIYALEKVLEYIKNRTIDNIYCLGDIIGYGDYPNECIELLASLNAICIKGNHEVNFFNRSESVKYNMEKTRDVLKPSNIDFLLNLQDFIEMQEYNAILAHTFPVGSTNYIYPNSDFTIFDGMDYKYFLIAHTHRPSYFTYFDKKIINPGSVGQPRDGNVLASAVFFDLSNDYFEFVRI